MSFRSICSTCPARLYTKNPNCQGCSRRAPNDRPSSMDSNYLDHYNRTNLGGSLRHRKER